MPYGTLWEPSSTASRQRNVPTSSGMTAISSQRENALAAHGDEGRGVPKQIGGGPKPIIRDEIAGTLRHLLEANNHLTRVECRDQLAVETGVRVNPWTVGRALRRLDWT